MIVLNSDYWYAPTLTDETATSGGLHGYIMDNQLEWLEKTVLKLEKDENIDHRRKRIYWFQDSRDAM